MADDTDIPADPGTQSPSPPFATSDDLATRWHAFTDGEKPHVDALMADASEVVMSICPNWAAIPASTLRVVVCGMVKRALINEDTGGVSQSTQTANGFTESLSYANPMGDLYPNQTEKRMLGLGRQRMWSIDLASGEASI